MTTKLVMKPHTETSAHQGIVCQADIAAWIGPQYFNPDFYGENAQAVSQGGRNAAWFVHTDYLNGVLRAYRRGGLVARVNRRFYRWQGAQQTRSWAEWYLLEYLYEAGLAVPKPLAAYYQKHMGLCYTAAILTQTITQSRPLLSLLQNGEGTPLLAQRVAAVIHQMHELGVWHADLNGFNILVDADQKVWLIDFDKSEKRCPEFAWKNQNLLRLQRSLVKVLGEPGLVFWTQIYENYLNL